MLHHNTPIIKSNEINEINEINKQNNFNDIDYNKILNSKCLCGTGLPWKDDKVVMAHPCEHMFHSTCVEKYCKNKKCGICKIPISRYWSMTDKDIHHQRFSDILSMSYYDNMSNNTPARFIDSIFDLATIFARLPFASNNEDGKDICQQLLAMNNVNLKVYGLNKIKKERKKVYICNHVTILELPILFYLLETGFLASSAESDNPITQKIKKVVPLLTFNRGEKNRKINIVDEMRKFVDKRGSICLFPEGLMKHPDALIRFRTGAFNIGYPVYAIVIRHNDIITDGFLNNFMYKLGAKKDIHIEVHVLGPYYPPFDETKIENIRHDMAKYGKLVLSRVSNRDIKDENKKE